MVHFLTRRKEINGFSLYTEIFTFKKMESKQINPRVSVMRSRTNLLDGSYLDYISQASSSSVDDSPPPAPSSSTTSSEMSTSEYELSASSTSSDEDIVSPQTRKYWTARETGLVEDAFAEETGYPGKTKILQIFHKNERLLEILSSKGEQGCIPKVKDLTRKRSHSRPPNTPRIRISWAEEDTDIIERGFRKLNKCPNVRHIESVFHSSAKLRKIWVDNGRQRCINKVKNMFKRC